MERKLFLKTGLLTLGTAVVLPHVFGKDGDEKPIYNEELITDFVFAAHNDLDKTKKLVDKNPTLLNCANQYKKGDFETAIGGASHMGRRDIADLLVAKGARLDIFNLTFLGFTEQVKALILAMPNYLNAPGPHGFTLLHHANAGKHIDFALWLQDQGLTETHFKGIF